MTSMQTRAVGLPRLAVSSRGDALTDYLTAALAERYDVAGRIDMELSSRQRLLVAAATFRPSRRAWVERFYKSGLGYQLRTRNGEQQFHALHRDVDVTLQVHALFEQLLGTHVIYVDVTHRQTAQQWPEWNPLQGKALRRWYERERLQYLRAAHLFAFSTQTARSLVQDYDVPAERVTVVGAGVNFRQLPDVTTRTATDAPTLLFIGNDFVRKGGNVLLAAFAEVRRQVPRATLQIVGTPHRIADQPGVRVLGRVRDRAQVARLYAAADVFAMPSYFDPFPLVLLEAMASGLPCVATDTCAIPDIVQHGQTGLLVTTGDVAGLTDALLALLLDPDRAQLFGRAGRLRAESQFLWPQVVDRMGPALDHLARLSDPTAGRAG